MFLLLQTQVSLLPAKRFVVMELPILPAFSFDALFFAFFAHRAPLQAANRPSAPMLSICSMQ